MFASVLSKSEPHQRTIIHLDMDYFYAQVEEIRDPTLKTKPLGIQQKNIVVTCNYIARKCGVKKLMLVSEAKRICPTLVLVVGEDLAPYRQMSNRIFEILNNYTPAVEKLGFDENYIDVTVLVEAREQQNVSKRETGTNTGSDEDDDMHLSVEGNIYPNDGATLNACHCGCAERLAIGTQIASEIRKDLHSKLGITCCAGISYNKLLAKLVGAQNKPNQQTVLVSTHTEQFMRELGELHRITGIGQKTETLLLESGVTNVEQLQRCDMDFLRKKFGFETATKLKDLAFGRDTGVVRPSGKPKSIGLEDSCRPISVRTDVEERFRLLLMRLIEQVGEDGRIPICIKVILRKFDAQKKSSHRETKQANILPSLFKSTPCTDTGGAKVMLAEGAQEKLIKIIMRLFERVVDLSKPFNITLIGLAFSKFQQRKVGPSSIANFLIKKTDLEVQSITSLTNPSVTPITSASPTPSISSANSDDGFRSSPTTFQPSDQFYRRRATAASPIPMLIDNGSESAATNSDFSDFSETEIEPSPKKCRMGRLLINKRRCFGSPSVCNIDTASEVASPSKLRVSDLRLNSRDSERDYPMCTPVNATNVQTATANSMNSNTLPTPSTPNAFNLTAVQRFRTIQPPTALVTRIDRMECSNNCSLSPTFRRIRQISTSSLASSPSTPSPLPSPLDETISNSCGINKALAPITQIIPNLAINASNSDSADTPTFSPSISFTTTNRLSNVPCPAGVDPEVFNSLPIDVQNELIASWRNSLAAAAAAVANGEMPSTSSSSSQALNPSLAKPQKSAGSQSSTTNVTQKNTLYRYFLRNK